MFVIEGMKKEGEILCVGALGPNRAVGSWSLWQLQCKRWWDGLCDARVYWSKWMRVMPAVHSLIRFVCVYLILRVCVSRYNELLFIIDTCQGASMYERFYSPNIMALASSQVGEDSLSVSFSNEKSSVSLSEFSCCGLMPQHKWRLFTLSEGLFPTTQHYSGYCCRKTSITFSHLRSWTLREWSHPSLTVNHINYAIKINDHTSQLPNDTLTQQPYHLFNNIKTMRKWC